MFFPHIFEAVERKGCKAHWGDGICEVVGRERKGRGAGQLLNFCR